MAFRITGLIHATEQVHSRLAEIASSCRGCSEISFKIPVILALQNDIAKTVLRVETLCAKRQATPSDLPNPSFHAFQWLRFLLEEKWLLIHIHALAEFQEILDQGKDALLPKIDPSRVRLEIKNNNYLYRCSQTGKIMRIEINEGFINAPKSTKERLLSAATSRRSKKTNQTIKTYTQDPQYKIICKALMSDERVNQISTKGHCYDLEEIFQSLNQKYFGGKLSRPRLSWSPRRSRRRLGYFHPESDAITISRTLDDPNVNQLLVEYILYHEMLHKALGIRETNGRRYAHTKKFKKAEKQFEGFNLAQELMRQFSGQV